MPPDCDHAETHTTTDGPTLQLVCLLCDQVLDCIDADELYADDPAVQAT